MISPLASPFRGGWRNLTPMRGRGRGGANPWTPGQLSSLRAWYDAEAGQPKNVGYVQLGGTSGDYIFTPDSAATSFSNDIEVVMRVKVTDWTAASSQTLVGKYVSTGNQRSWRFYVSAAGVIGLSVSADGSSTVTTVSVTPTNALPDDTWIWLRMRLDLTNGSNSVGTLETATDAGDNIEPSSWTANGTNTGTTISGVFDSTAPTEIGSFAAGTLERLAGQVGRCIVRSGFSGTTVADFNASDCYGDGYWHSGGYQWTLGLPKIYDRSVNNRAPATFGSGSNQPRWLRWTGTSCVHLESASAGTNSISCTAPSGAASYVARSRDYPNVADDTGAAAAGAFAFTTAGQWQYISILNGSAVEIARFDASLCTQTGMTDSYSVAWTVNRGTAGRKTVVQSPVARSARSLILFGTDDFITVPDAAIPTSTPYSMNITNRRWATQVSGVRAISNRAAGTTVGHTVFWTPSGYAVFVQDGSGSGTQTSPLTNWTGGVRDVLTSVRESALVTAIRNGDAAISTATALGASHGGTGYLVGANPGPGNCSDAEYEAIILRDAATSAAEHGLLAAYYRGGL